MEAVTGDALAAINPASEQTFRVGRASVDPLSRDATFDGQSERLQPQNLKVLIALARQRGKLVTRDQLVEQCWDGRFVGDDVINRAISTLRQFAERAGGFAIETVPRAGYRLIETSRSRRMRGWLIGAAIAGTLGLAGLVFLGSPREIAARPTPTIAVAPFTTSSADSHDRQLASDTRDAVAHTLSQTEYRVSLSDGVQGKQAPADFVVSANVGGSSRTVVVTVRVEDILHNAIVYSNRFEADRGKVADLPDRIGAQIAGSLGWTAALLMVERSHPSDPAITAELFGQKENYQSALQIASRAPNSPNAQITLAFDATGAIWDLPSDQQVEVLDVGRHALERVRELAPGFGGADILWCHLHSRVRLIECEDHLRAGMRRDPDSAWVETSLASQLKDVGRTNEALSLSRNTLAHDPYVPDKIEMMLRMLGATGQNDEAEALYRQSQRWWPDSPIIFSGLLYGMMDRGDFEALSHLAKEVEGTGVASFIEPSVPLLAAVRAKDVARIRKLCPVDQPPSVARDICMLALAQVGDNDRAFALASRIYPNRVGRTPEEEDRLWLGSSRFGESDILMGAAAAPLRRDPRYLALARRLGLLAYWRSGRLPDFCDVAKKESICALLRRQH